MSAVTLEQANRIIAEMEKVKERYDAVLDRYGDSRAGCL